MPVNSKQKGKRIELEIVHWLKNRGISSAQRSAQFQGMGLGDSDVIAKTELPKFHLEVKGRKEKYIYNSLLRDWWDQLENDCPEDQIPVIFFVANNEDPVVLMPVKSYELLFGLPPKDELIFSFGDSFEVVRYLQEWDHKINLRKQLGVLESPYKVTVIHEIYPGKVFMGVHAERALMYMKEYGKN